MEDAGQQREIWSIGHSTRTMEEFMDILHSFQIEQLVDVRRFPGSRKYPHFNIENLVTALPEKGIKYLHLEDLGGRRKVAKTSENTAWRLASFRGYADHMETETFRNAAAKLCEMAKNNRVAYMCSEAVWWSCHRSLISDYLKIRKWKVNHIMAEAKEMEHPYTKPARIIDGKLSYKAEALPQ